MIGKMTVKELEKRIQEKKNPYLLDVREPFEREICKLEDQKNIPLKQLPERLSELSKDQEIVVYCRSGGRSLQACQFLETQGFTNLTNLAGGVLAWSDFVDPTMTKY